jgi:hypothetical protein
MPGPAGTCAASHCAHIGDPSPLVAEIMKVASNLAVSLAACASAKQTRLLHQIDLVERTKHLGLPHLLEFLQQALRRRH